MIEFVVGNLLESNAEVLVNTVNTVGVMGKGIALQFKNEFHHNYKVYLKACREKTFNIGDLIITEEESLLYGKKTIINLPTKTSWKKPAEYSYIEAGLKALAETIRQRDIKSIAIPPLGAGNGGLNWEKVKELMIKYLSTLDSNIYIYQPNSIVQEVLNKERVKLTPARAMLLAVLFEVVKNGEFVSEFAAEKVAYFLQKFGAQNVFKLEFKQNFYGPYSGKVKRVLYYLNGSYIVGFSGMDKKPFEELGLMMNAEKDVIEYLNTPDNEPYMEIVNLTKKFLKGFYSSFGLELLSTIDFLVQKNGSRSLDDIVSHLNSWNTRKRTLFSNPKFVQIALNQLEAFEKKGA